jgi:2-hydroxycyclohexanecarboxyl-CoA dehydrogenase
MSDPILDLHGQVALVTGAGQGVGRKIVLHLAAHGARAVVVNDVDADRAEKVAEEARDLGAKTQIAQVDVGDFEAVSGMFERAAAEFGPVGILVNNAGNRGAGPAPRGRKPFWEQGPEDWAPFFHVNLDGVMNCSRHAMAGMVGLGHGRIVTVVSDAGRVGEINGLEAYSGAKAGAAGFTRAMARLGGRYGVTANSVALGATRTPATEAAMADENYAKKALASYIVRRFGEPDDAANMVLFLASGAAGWITGQTIPVNGGYSMAL